MTGLIITLVIAIGLVASIVTSTEVSLSEEHRSTAANTSHVLNMENWPSSPAYTLAFSALDPLALPNVSNELGGFDPEDEYWGLPRTNGYELVDAYCSGCHSLQIVMQQRADETRWRYMLQWMSEEQNMPELPQDEEEIVLKYLLTHFGSASTVLSAKSEP